MGKTYEALKKTELETQKVNGKKVNGKKVNGSASNGAALSAAFRTGQLLSDTSVPSQVQYQRIRVWLNNTPTAEGRRIQTVMIVSPRSGTGSTTTSALLASTLAEGKRSRVLLVDGNFRTPSLNLVFQVKNEGGFTELATEEEPMEAHIQPTNRPNLFVLTSGKIGDVPVEIFEGEKVDRLIQYLMPKFNYVIFDAAPVLEYPDALLLASKVDVVILVVQSEGTQIEEARLVKRDLEQAGANIIGAVLNRRRDYTPRFLREHLRLE